MKETKYAGTQTEKNLMAAFAGESEARNKYTYFASKAKKEGYEQIAALFLKTADNGCPFHAHCVPVPLPHQPVFPSPDSGLRCGGFHHFLPLDFSFL